MARIADKYGLTNKYRESGNKRIVRRGRPRKYLFGAPKSRTRKKQIQPKINKTLEIQTPTTKQTLGCVGCGTIVLAIFVIFCAVISLTTSDQSNDSKSDTTTSQSQEDLIDLSFFDGNPGVEAKVNIEKESNDHLLDVNVYVTNSGEKSISKLTLYFVKCYDDKGPLENTRYNDRLKLENISSGQTEHARWVLGTTNAGALEYKVYVAYVLYDDGSEWGTETVDHRSVVTRSETVDVNYYNDGVLQ